jgi:hypothetical protein
MSTLAKPFTESDGAPTAAPVSDSLLAPATDGAPAPAAPAAASTPTLTRRSMVAGMATGLMPAPTAAAAAPGRDPDARLLELGEQYRDLCALEPAANDACEQCCGSVPEVNRPQALRHRLEDHVFGLDLPFAPDAAAAFAEPKGAGRIGRGHNLPLRTQSAINLSGLLRPRVLTDAKPRTIGKVAACQGARPRCLPARARR